MLTSLLLFSLGPRPARALESTASAGGSSAPGAAAAAAAAAAEEANRWMGDLRPSAPVPPAEQEAWVAAMDRFSRRVERDDFTALAAFLEPHRTGAWATALRVRLAEELYLTGWYSRAVRLLEEVWAERDQPDAMGAGSARVRGGVKLAELYARLGRREDVERVLAQAKVPHLAPGDVEIVRGIEQGLAKMRSEPERAFRCGALALERIRVFQDPSKAGHPKLLASRSSAAGMSLAEVGALAAQLGMEYRTAYRTPGAALLTPSVMHLALGHFVAVVRERKGQAQLEDPTGWETTFASRAAVDAEASGYFLVPAAGGLPAGWRAVDAAEAGTVWGRNGVLDNDPDGSGKRDKRLQCGGGDGRSAASGASSRGMATWDVHLMLLSQQVVDTPVGYEPPFGPPVYVTLRHTQRANERFGYRPTWTHSWSGQLYENPRTPLGDLWLQDEGGWERFVALDEEGTVYQGRVFNTGRVERTTRTNLVWTFPDGTRRIYTTFAPTNVVWARIFQLTGIEDASGNRVTIQVSPNGRVEALVDPLGRATRFLYELTDPGVPPTPDPLVLPVLANYDFTNQVTRIVDPFGRVARLDYAKTLRYRTGFCGSETCAFAYYNYDLTNITDVAGLSSRFVYDNSGLWVTNLTTPYGTTSFRWTSAYAGNYALEITDPEGGTERLEFGGASGNGDALWQLPEGMLAEAGSFGRTVAYWSKKAYAESYRPGSPDGATLYTFQLSETLSAAGRVLESLKRPLEGRVWFNYPGQGSPLLPGIGDQPSRIGRVLDDGRTQLWQIERDAWGNVVRNIDPVGRTASQTYAANHIDLLEVRQTRDGQGEVWFRAAYDDRHRPVSITDAAGSTARFAYNARGQLERVTDARGGVTEFVHDADGYLVAVDGPLPGAQDRFAYAYDAAGRVRTVTDPDGYALTLDYDALDRITRVGFPDGTAQETDYDRLKIGRLRDRLGHELRFAYDGLRRLTSVQDALGRLTQFQWCGCGALSAAIDPLGRMTRWYQDTQGRLAAQEYADGSRVEYAYERSTSRLRRVRDAAGQIVEYDYGLDDSLAAKRFVNPRQPTPDLGFTYDPDYPRLASMADADGITRFRYHPVTATPTPGAGRLAAIDGPLDNDEIGFEYDELGRVVARTLGGVAARRAFDAAGRLTRLTNALGAFDYAWDGGSARLAQIRYPNGQRAEYAYEGNAGDHRLRRLTHWLPDGGKLAEFLYAFNAQGQITNWSKLQAGQLKTWAVAYDAVDRLTRVAERDQAGAETVFAYSYDAADNRTLEQVNAERHEFAYDTLNQLASFTPDTLVPPTAYEWDAERRLTAIVLGSRRTELRYDALGRRTRVTEKDGAATLSDRRYIWCGPELCEERDARSGAVLKRYTELGLRAEPGAGLPAGNHFYARDHLASVSGVTDDSGAVEAQFAYTPFGEQRRVAGAASSDFGFTGHFAHGGSPLLLAPFRAYDPRLGRWLSRDPLGESQGLNLFAYVANDPLNRRDALGLFPTGGHNWLIDYAFDRTATERTRLSSSERDILKTASRRVDDDQSADGSYKHAMRTPGQTQEQAWLLYFNFVRERRQKAACLELQGKHDDAMAALGEGLHAVMDNLSPAHQGFQEWRGIGLNPANWARGLAHAAHEFFEAESASTEGTLQMQEYYSSFLDDVKHCRCDSR